MSEPKKIEKEKLYKLNIHITMGEVDKPEESYQSEKYSEMQKADLSMYRNNMNDFEKTVKALVETFYLKSEGK